MAGGEEAPPLRPPEPQSAGGGEIARILCCICGGFVRSIVSPSSVARDFQDMRMAVAATDPGSETAVGGRGREGDITPDLPWLCWPRFRHAADDGELTSGGAKELAALSGGEAAGGA
mmetsp:Transcript_114191/g.333857  ORF Transcript_114191/g.333857 Transcript_114191/m.333857 type:complete len:117 (-) Transcript_114191:60-410(-)